MSAQNPGGLTLPQATALVAEREIVDKLRSKAFLVTTTILVLGAIAAVVIMSFLANRDSTTSVATTPDVGNVIVGVDGFDVTPVQNREAGEELLRDGDVDALITGGAGNTGFTVVALDSVPQDVVLLLSQQPDVELLEGDPASTGMRMILGIGFGVVFMMAGMTFGAPVASSVVEEKATRIVEILLSAIPARALLAGKVLGNTVIAMSQILLLVVAVAIGLIATGQTDVLATLGAPVLWFAAFFLFGFVLIASMFAAAGSMVSRSEDVGATMTPIMWIVMIPYFVVIFFAENAVVMTVTSYVPFGAPVAMPIRLFFNEAQWWEPLLSLVLLVATCAGIVTLAAKIYENSLLKMGSRVKLREALAK
ncbi:ABC transporter permease [Microbacterium amylolyticum]|uniref:ABC-2 type transport system permease protein n=1 Tax=Microbacterium amylolyticum TaxID=936337 RepID=A0ABS4ZHL1_9MICO|nr:ABC transporter permease [Microbacterium amylolyticum]MBP2436762.1 ABC-2 type transport system permease protein [Microbacterium amylolyticum]